MRRAMTRLAAYERRPYALQKAEEISAILTEELTQEEQRALARRQLPEYRAALARMRAVDPTTLPVIDAIVLKLRIARVTADLAQLEALVGE